MLKDSVHVQFGELECSLVLWLFLDPVDIRAFPNLCYFVLNFLDWEGSQLFDPDNLDLFVVYVSSFNFCIDIKKNFSWAKHNRFRWPFSILVHVYWLEWWSLPHLIYGRDSLWVLEPNFRGGHDQWLSESSVHLPSQDMEVVRGHSALSNLKIDVLRVQLLESC